MGSGNDRSSVQQTLAQRFGFPAFRPNQEEVCTWVSTRRDALLVMPTGSGKSLCYQLPGVCLGGTTIVVSPLIALMEDQVSKLKEQGFVAERIHSGCDREDSRAVCRDYLDGKLDFLFMAPERLSVPGFPEFLARRTPALVAVDEAHCISHWGHDFRPDYRQLGEWLPRLRPCPVIAVTATATVRVQNDIVSALGLKQPKRFIRGFWRDNLACEAVEEPRLSGRLQRLQEILVKPERLPAIVYVPSRQQATEIAAVLPAGLTAVAYHAGMESGDRSKAQEGFMAGHHKVIVATVAFGMGVDKPDIRTVVHMATPSTIENYYQEIGRAGRDGQPSRAILFYSWSDRRLLEFLHDRSYPDTEFLEEILKAIPPHPVSIEQLSEDTGYAEDDLEPALRQLLNHRAIVWSGRQGIQRTGKQGWKKTYQEQSAHRLGQIEDVLKYAQGHGCRMGRLVAYFSESEAEGRTCGLCDVCAPQTMVARALTPPDPAQQELADGLLRQLRSGGSAAAGTLFKWVCESRSWTRRQFEDVLSALTRSELVIQTEQSFQKAGEVIRFRRVELTREGTRQAVTGARFRVDGPAKPVGEGAAKDRSSASSGQNRQRTSTPAPSEAIADDIQESPLDEALWSVLRTWRKAESTSRGIPPFMVASNAVLKALARARPTTSADLLKVKGVGPAMVERYGRALVTIFLRFPAQ